MARLKFLPTLLLAAIAIAKSVDASSASGLRAKRQTSQDSCGVPSEVGTGLILNGETFAKNSWPWMVALLLRQKESEAKQEPKFFCAGTLISRKQVLTGELLIKIEADFQ